LFSAAVHCATLLLL